jgi:lipopolysaccharide/colanic/teichoic acid biosynthesis glycosyltransferase
MLKRLVDIVLSGFALLIFLPVLAVVAAAIKCDSRGPVFYRGVRIGRGGKPFRVFKYRSMVVNAERIGGSSTSDDDPRITRVGRFLRKYKLDELPELINVVRGDMSLVGPRPEVAHYVSMYTEKEKAILTVRPGLTDWATLWNSDEGAVLEGSEDPERVYLERIRPIKIALQLKYVRDQSFWVDLQIFGQTLAAVIFRMKPKALEEIKGSTGERHVRF